MIDIKLVRENPEILKENIKKKFKEEKLKLIDEARNLDEKWRKLKFDEDKLRKERNDISKKISGLKKTGKKADSEIKKAKDIPSKIEKLEEKRKKVEEKLNSVLIKIPNLMSENVPVGKDESENVEVKKFGVVKDKEVENHVDVIENLGVGDFDSAARVSGTGFYYLEGDLALLNRALINFAIDKMVEKDFEYVETPYLLREEIIDKVTDLNDKEQQIYLTKEDDLGLIGTSEHSLIGRYAGQEIEYNDLPLKQTSYSMCFRKEIGSHGVDEKGLFRTHQFNKVEMVVICKPEESEKFFKEMQGITIEIFKDLEIPIRILQICSGDLGTLKHEQIDVEAWSPRQKKYFEVGSCSNLTDAQARKLEIYTRINNERIVPHTLNNTALASSRALVAILENYQQKDGSVKIPKVLIPYMNGKNKISGKSKK